MCLRNAANKHKILINSYFWTMTNKQLEMIRSDFEKYMKHSLTTHKSFTMEKFVSFATSLVNFYVGSNLISKVERGDTALILSKSYNAGLGNIISPDDLRSISELIISDPTLDYSILSPIFA